VTSCKLVFALLSCLQVLSVCGAPTERYTSVSLVLGPCHLILSSFRVHIRVPAEVIRGMFAKFEMQLPADTPLSCPVLCMVCMMHARKGTRFHLSYWRRDACSPPLACLRLSQPIRWFARSKTSEIATSHAIAVSQRCVESMWGAHRKVHVYIYIYNITCSRASPSYLILFLCAYLRVPVEAIGGMFAKIERHLPTSTTFSFAGGFRMVCWAHTHVRARS
jgi:hypothetical protein